MNLLLAYLAVALFLGLRGVGRSERGLPEPPAWQLLIPAIVVAIGFLSQRML